MIIRRARVATSKTLGLVKIEIKVFFFFSTILSFDVATDRSVHSTRRVQRVYARRVTKAKICVTHEKKIKRDP